MTIDTMKIETMTIETTNPATGNRIAQYSVMDEQTIDSKLNQAWAAFLQWRQQPLRLRQDKMRRLADILSQKKQELATLITQEMGKPITASCAEIDKTQTLIHYYCDQAEDFLQDQVIKTEKKKSFISYRPLGAVFAIMPWNFPVWQVFRFAVPNLLLGNVGLLKHAPISTGLSLMLETMFIEAGFDPGVFTSLVLSNEGASRVIADARVKGVTLTGSAKAGALVAAQAGAVLKKTVLELGGTDPYLVLDDADLDQAARCIVKARFANSGQVCIAPKRVIVVDRIYDAFKEKVLTLADTYVCGDPMDEQTRMGPLARSDLRANVHAQVQTTQEKGATVLLGGVLPEGPGYYYPATVIEGITAGMPAYEEEIFGPVLCLFRVRDEAQAIQLANASPYGLGGAVFSADVVRAEAIARDLIQVGSCCVNTNVSSDPRLPFGGIGQSGFGRELSLEGMREFVNIKTISIA